MKKDVKKLTTKGNKNVVKKFINLILTQAKKGIKEVDSILIVWLEGMRHWRDFIFLRLYTKQHGWYFKKMFKCECPSLWQIFSSICFNPFKIAHLNNWHRRHKNNPIPSQCKIRNCTSYAYLDKRITVVWKRKRRKSKNHDINPQLRRSWRGNNDTVDAIVLRKI